MKKLLSLMLVCILILSGFGATAVSIPNKLYSEISKNSIYENEPLSTPPPPIMVQIARKLGIFGIFFLVKNEGWADTGPVDWRISFKGHILIPYSWCRIGTLNNIPGESARIIGTLVFGFNLFKPAIVDVHLEWEEGKDWVDAQYAVSIIGFITFIVS